MRWRITESKRRIESVDFEGHSDDVEMSGERVSAIVAYGAEQGAMHCELLLVFPWVRLQPDVTQSSYQVRCSCARLFSAEEEKFLRVAFDGTLSVFTESHGVSIERIFYPSVGQPVFYERVRLDNKSGHPVNITFEKYKKLDGRIACEGFVYAERTADSEPCSLAVGEKKELCFCYTARFADQPVPAEENSLEKRRQRVSLLFSQCDLETGNSIFDTMYTFAKLRAGESIYRTKKGLVHSPGGTNYYAAVWCNDQCEYATPWFAFTGDEKEKQAAKNAMHWYRPFMNDEYIPIPSSIISEGTDYWNDRRDRGDAAMYLYGNSRYFLTAGETPTQEEMWMLDWCAEYTLRQINEHNVVVSDTDELEFRLSSGINLATSCIAYGAFGLYACLLRREGKKERAVIFEEKRTQIRGGIESWFGAEIEGYHTYAYHKGCNEIRAWNCLPAFMGISERAEETADSIRDRLWMENGCRSGEHEEILWDRSALYGIASLFRQGRREEAWQHLMGLSTSRLLGERVPYAVEAYPEFNMRHLSAESALYCRIVTDGLLNISFTENGFIVDPRLPSALRSLHLEKIVLCGILWSVEVGTDRIRVVSADGKKVYEGGTGTPLQVSVREISPSGARE